MDLFECGGGGASLNSHDLVNWMTLDGCRLR